jgi:hypothetical protein
MGNILQTERLVSAVQVARLRFLPDQPPQRIGVWAPLFANLPLRSDTG